MGNNNILKSILKKKIDKDLLNLFILRIKTVSTNLTENKIVKLIEIIEDDNYLLLIREKYSNTIECMKNDDLESFTHGISCNKMILSVCDIISEFHKNDIYHGGIKLSNIFMNEESDEYFISDHCIKILNTKDLNINKKTIKYLSPEELNEKEISIKIDLWLFGVLLYKLFNKKYPFERDTLLESELKIINVEYERIIDEKNEKYNNIIEKLLVKDETKRININNLKNELLNINKSEENAQETSFPLSLSEECYFIENHKHIDIIITNNDKTITKVMPINNFAHCYLNIKMSEGIHHFIYQINGYCGGFFFGGSLNNEYDGDFLPDENHSCCIAIGEEGAKLFGCNGYKVKDGIFNEIKNKDGGKYDMIFDCNKKEVYMKEENEKEMVLLFSNIELPLFPFVSILYPDFSVDLINYYKE